MHPPLSQGKSCHFLPLTRFVSVVSSDSSDSSDSFDPNAHGPDYGAMEMHVLSFGPSVPEGSLNLKKPKVKFIAPIGAQGVTMSVNLSVSQ